jgi:hypothetical protein
MEKQMNEIVETLKEKIKTYNNVSLKEIIKSNFDNIGIRALIIDELELRIGSAELDNFLDTI